MRSSSANTSPETWLILPTREILLQLEKDWGRFQWMRRSAKQVLLEAILAPDRNPYGGPYQRPLALADLLVNDFEDMIAEDSELRDGEYLYRVAELEALASILMLQVEQLKEQLKDRELDRLSGLTTPPPSKWLGKDLALALRDQGRRR